MEWALKWNAQSYGLVTQMEWVIRWNGHSDGIVIHTEWTLRWNGYSDVMDTPMEWAIIWNENSEGMVTLMEKTFRLNGYTSKTFRLETGQGGLLSLERDEGQVNHPHGVSWELWPTTPRNLEHNGTNTVPTQPRQNQLMDAMDTHLFVA